MTSTLCISLHYQWRHKYKPTDIIKTDYFIRFGMTIIMITIFNKHIGKQTGRLWTIYNMYNAHTDKLYQQNFFINNTHILISRKNYDFELLKLFLSGPLTWTSKAMAASTTSWNSSTYSWASATGIWGAPISKTTSHGQPCCNFRKFASALSRRATSQAAAVIRAACSNLLLCHLIRKNLYT